MPATSKVNRAKNRQKKRTRGRAPSAKVGDILSVINSIETAEDKFDVEVVNNLGKMYDILLDQALARNNFTDVGVKDQTKAIEYCVKRAESLIDEYYEDEEEMTKPALGQGTPSNGNTPEEEEEEFEEGAEVLSLEFNG